MFELLQNLIFYIWIQDNVWENIEEGGDIEIDIIEMRVVALFEYKDVMGHAVKSIFAVAEVWINLIFILFLRNVILSKVQFAYIFYAREWRIWHDKNYLIYYAKQMNISKLFV